MLVSSKLHFMISATTNQTPYETTQTTNFLKKIDPDYKVGSSLSENPEKS